MLNSVNLIGRLTREPEMRYSQSGTAICNFNIAVNRQFKNANGEREADFINIVQFGKGAELTAQYVRKGHQIGLTGRIQSGSYEKDGRTIYTTEVVADQVVFLESKGNNQSNQQKQINAANNEINQHTTPSQNQQVDVKDLDLPF